MTQEVQPLTWQKRTNIEEHQQFFAKINEIVGQLSGTVERSETALEEANTALTNARTAVATANAASAQATEAATTVAGFNTRLTAVEVQAATNKSDISQLDVETQVLYDRDAQSVKLSADHIQVITGGLDLRGTNISPNTTVGEDDTVIANGHRIVQELDAYSPMVRTTGSQKVDGIKTMVQRLDFDSSGVNLDSPPVYVGRGMTQVNTGANSDVTAMREEMIYSDSGTTLQFTVHAHGSDEAHTDYAATLMLTVFRDGTARVQLVRPNGTVQIVPKG